LYDVTTAAVAPVVRLTGLTGVNQTTAGAGTGAAAPSLSPTRFCSVLVARVNFARFRGISSVETPLLLGIRLGQSPKLACFMGPFLSLQSSAGSQRLQIPQKKQFPLLFI
jgi:hypothetical protein